MNENAIEETTGYEDFEGYEEATNKPKGLYFSLFKFRLALRSSEPLDGYVGPFTTRNPQTDAEVISYAKFFDSIIARIIYVERKKREFDTGGKVINWNIKLIAKNKRSTLQFQQKDSALKRFLKVARNIDFNRPIRISAWAGKNTKGKDTQSIAFYQGLPGQHPENWDKVEEYWVREKGPNGKPIQDAPSVGADGSVMPKVHYDEVNEEYDDREQMRFLVEQFMTHVKPITDTLGHQYDAIKDDTEELTHTGSDAMAMPPVPEVTEKPSNFIQTSMADMLTGQQRAEIITLCEQIGSTPATVVEKVYGQGVSLEELSKTGASYVKHALLTRLEAIKRKTTPAEVEAAPPPPPPPPPPPVAVPAPAPASVDDIWDDVTTPAPAPPANAGDAWEDDDPVVAPMQDPRDEDAPPNNDWVDDL